MASFPFLLINVRGFLINGSLRDRGRARATGWKGVKDKIWMRFEGGRGRRGQEKEGR